MCHVVGSHLRKSICYGVCCSSCYNYLALKYFETFKRTREAARLIVPDGQLKTWASHYFYRFGSLGQLVFDFKHGEGNLQLNQPSHSNIYNHLTGRL